MNEKSTIGELFDRIAGKYDFLNHLLSLNIDKLWRQQGVSRLTCSAGACPSHAVHILDVAIGTGDLALELLRQHKADEVTGIDLSEEMMRIGQQKAVRAGQAEHIQFMRASAFDMPFEDNTFDAVTCSYGVRNFADLERGLREMHRVVRPGGQVMILEFSQPTNRLIAWVYDLYFMHILPHVGRLLSGDKTAYTYLNRSVKTFADARQMHEHLTHTGWERISHTPQTFGISTIYIAYKPTL